MDIHLISKEKLSRKQEFLGLKVVREYINGEMAVNKGMNTRKAHGIQTKQIETNSLLSVVSDQFRNQKLKISCA